MNPFLDVRKFHRTGGLPVQDSAALPEDIAVRKLRINLLVEEVLEYLQAEQDHDLTEIADGLIDICYIAIGTCIAYGIPFDMVWDEVQRSNMDKFKGGVNIRHDGKILKPEGWKPPNIKSVIDSMVCSCESSNCKVHHPVV